MRSLFKLLLIVLLAPLLIAPQACKKNTTCTGVPNVAVNFQLNINSPNNSPLVPVTGYNSYTGGNYGVIVYHYTTNEFKAYDCMCPYEGTGNTKSVVQPQSGGIYAKCAVCGSTFLLSDGSVSKGPATCPLKAYNATYDGSTYITVTN